MATRAGGTAKAARKTAAKTTAAKTTAAKTTAAKTTVKKTTAKKTTAARTAAKRTAPEKTAAKKTARKTARKTAATRTAGALAAGAARASGERAKRRSTPLIQGTVPRTSIGVVPEDVLSPRTPAVPASTTPQAETPAAETPTAVPTPPVAEVPDAEVPDAAAPVRKLHRPHPVGKAVPTKKAVARTGTRTPPVQRRSARTRPPGPPERGQTRSTQPSTQPSTQESTQESTRTSAPTTPTPTPTSSGTSVPAPGRRLAAVHELPSATAQPAAVPAPAPSSHVRVAPGVAELLRAGVAALRVAAEGSGLAPEEVERQVAETLAFLRRRLTGDYQVDEFGFDEDFTEHAYLPLLRPLYKRWFRVEVRGIENIPTVGGALVVANHSGTVAMDSLMTQVAVHDEHPAHRHLRMLGADLVFQTPVVGKVARKSGSTLAANADAERLLGNGELAGVWPEGFKGVGKPFSERYKLQRFGRGGFVSAALRTGVPIIPCSIVGAEEIYPIIGNMRTVARLLGVPYAPITPTWPLLGPLGLLPLPSKWIIEFGSPVETADLGPGAADDPMLVFELTDQVRETIQQTLYSLLMQRRSVFF